MQKECIAMLLAGGEGSRLGVLTKKRAKPALPFGGKYRLIDFTLSNCVNSGIDTVGILVQYQPLDLNDYIGNGQPWDLDLMEGGVHILPPYQKQSGSDWYKGTADAIYQNIPFIERYNPEYILILSGDHIYKMDYSLMLKYHKDHHADCTIAVIDVSLKDASRFGIMNFNTDGRINEFEEKPEKPKSTTASMGVYIFNWGILRHYLELDQKDTNSSYDFGKNLIPSMLQSGERVFAYQFDDYWKDVGTVESLWDTTMDLLRTNTNNILNRSEWKIYTRNPIKPPHYINVTAKITNSIISEGCIIEGNIDTSVVFYGVKVERGAIVRESIIMPGAHIKKNAYIYKAIIDENTVIGEDEVIGYCETDEEKDSDQSIVVVSNDDGSMIGSESD